MFQSINDLPALIRSALPHGAQELYRAAYNRTWERLAAGEAMSARSMAVESHKAARLAVRFEFSQDEDGHWHRDPVGEDIKRRGNVENEPDTG